MLRVLRVALRLLTTALRASTPLRLLTPDRMVAQCAAAETKAEYAWRSESALRLAQGAAGKEYQAGLEQFQTVAADTTPESILQQAHGECGLGRSGHQITGW